MGVVNRPKAGPSAMRYGLSPERLHREKIGSTFLRRPSKVLLHRIASVILTDCVSQTWTPDQLDKSTSQQYAQTRPIHLVKNPHGTIGPIEGWERPKTLLMKSISLPVLTAPLAT